MNSQVQHIAGSEYVKIEPFVAEYTGLDSTTAYSQIEYSHTIETIYRSSNSMYNPFPLGVVITNGWYTDSTTTAGSCAGICSSTSSSVEARLSIYLTPNAATRRFTGDIRIEGYVIWGLRDFGCYSNSGTTPLTRTTYNLQYKSRL